MNCFFVMLFFTVILPYKNFSNIYIFDKGLFLYLGWKITSAHLVTLFRKFCVTGSRSPGLFCNLLSKAVFTRESCLSTHLCTSTIYFNLLIKVGSWEGAGAYPSWHWARGTVHHNHTPVHHRPNTDKWQHTLSHPHLQPIENGLLT